jgi:ABC-type multidrug transport system ATPase subunit
MEIVLAGVRKRFGREAEALRGVDLRIPGGVFAVVGPNGSGKTTLLRILATRIGPTAGRIRAGPHDLARPAARRALRASLGYVPQEIELNERLTGRELLDHVALLKGLRERRARRDQVAALLDAAGLSDAAEARIAAYSGGMKRRLTVAQALLGAPRLLVVDEPTAGLDPEERARVRTLLVTRGRDCTVVLATHLLRDVREICPSLAVLDGGALAFAGTATALAALAAGRAWELTTGAAGAPPEGLTVVSARPDPAGLLYRLIGSPAGRPPGLRVVAPTVEDGYAWLLAGMRGTRGAGHMSERTVTA